MRGLVVAVVLSTASPAFAHFRLIKPDVANAQDATGSPQFTGPCGDTAAPTGAVTQFTDGQTITVEIAEAIFHPGHYRVALAQTMAMLPADPVPTVMAGNCVSAPIDSTLPFVLADGVFAHTTQFSANQTVQVTLPAGMTCNDCVLQVIEFTASHAPPCFHYHCAILDITNIAPPVDAGPDGGGMDDAAMGSDGAVGDDAGSGSQNALVNPYANQGCSTSGSSSGLVAFVLGMLLCRRRHEKHRCTTRT